MAILTRPGGGQPFTKEEAKAIIDKYDTNKDGELDYDEFVKAFSSQDFMSNVSEGAQCGSLL